MCFSRNVFYVFSKNILVADIAVVFWDQHLKTLPLQVKLLAVQVRFGKSACATKEKKFNISVNALLLLSVVKIG